MTSICNIFVIVQTWDYIITLPGTRTVARDPPDIGRPVFSIVGLGTSKTDWRGGKKQERTSRCYSWEKQNPMSVAKHWKTCPFLCSISKNSSLPIMVVAWLRHNQALHIISGGIGPWSIFYLLGIMIESYRIMNISVNVGQNSGNWQLSIQ